MTKLKNKTRVLVTHAIDFLHFADSVIYLREGRVVFQGSYQEVKDSAYIKELYAIFRKHKKEQGEITGVSSDTKSQHSRTNDSQDMLFVDDNEEDDGFIE